MAPPPVFPEGTGPPDGGFGWVVAAAYALNNVVAIPILQNFGLVFRDVFVDLKLSGTDTAVIMNINNAFGLALGLFNGPLLRTFSYRKVAIFGSMLVFSGMVLTAFASSFVEFLVFYGFIMSSGYNLTMASFAYAINSYFSKRRGVAMGFAMTVTGLGPVFMPLVISMLMKEYGPRYTALILSGLALHSLVGALLLQPVRWHLVKLVPDKKAGEDDGDASPTKLPLLVKEGEGKKDSVLENGGVEGGKAAREDDAKLEGDPDEDCNAPMLVARRGSSVSRKSGATLSGRAGDERGLAPSMWASMASIHDGGIGGSFVGLDDDQQRNDKPAKANGLSKPKTDLSDTPWWRRWMHAVVEFFDLGLLRDPVYVNMMLGLSFAVFAEINFSLLTPFILGDRKFSTEQTASLVSIIAVADIIFRFLSPFVRRICRQSVRIMYMLGLLLLVLTRTVFIFCYSYESLIGVMVGLGVAKGLRTVFWLLVIPDYVPIERLPCANGLQSVTNGIVFMALGAPMGLIRDKLGDYNYVIIAINVMTCITLTMWCVEFIIVALRKKRRGRTTDADVEVEKKPKP